MKVSIIFNGNRPFSKLVKSVVEELESTPEMTINFLKTNQPRAAISLAKSAAEDSDVIISVGGDGTNNEVLNGIMTSNNPKVPLALLPNGTGNDFMKMLPSFDEKEFILSIQNLNVKEIDCGVLVSGSNLTYFLNIADIGFGAEVVRIMDEQRRRKIGGKLSYSLAIIRAFFHFRKPMVRLSYDNQVIESKLLMAVFSNGSTFGHGIGIYPDASLTNEKLGLTLIGDINLMTYIKYLKKLKKCEKIEHPEVRYSSFTDLKMELVQGKIYTEADGEFINKAITEVYVLPKSIQLIF